MEIPKINIAQQGAGIHNLDEQASIDRLEKGKTYQDLSTICVVPTRGMIHIKVVQSWLNMMAPMNQKFTRIHVVGMEVAAAYNWAIEQILQHPVLKDWKYVLTLEEDNLPPADGLLKLYESMDEYDVVGGLYWTKGEGGQPMIYGNPERPINFIPQKPQTDKVQRTWGLGMGFTLFKLDIFKNPDVPKPWFKTVQECNKSGGATTMTQDLYFYKNIGEIGYKVASDNRVKVGHCDPTSGIVW